MADAAPNTSVEQNVDSPVPGGVLHNVRFGQGSTASSSAPPEELFQGVFRTFPRPEKSAKVSWQVSAGVVANSSSSTPAAHHEVRDDLWVQIMTEDRAFFWNRLERTSHWEMPPGIRPGWVMSRDVLFVHLETQEVLQSISGMH